MTSSPIKVTENNLSAVNKSKDNQASNVNVEVDDGPMPTDNYSKEDFDWR